MSPETVLPMPPDGSLDVTSRGTEQSTGPPTGLWPAQPRVCEPVTGSAASVTVVSRRRPRGGLPVIAAVSCLLCPVSCFQEQRVSSYLGFSLFF